MSHSRLYRLRKPHRLGTVLRRLSIAVFILVISGPWPARAATNEGEIEKRPASVNRRVCVGSTNAGNLCKQDSDCGQLGSCEPTNVFNITVSVRFNATQAELDQIEEAFAEGSELLFDVTDGQARFGDVRVFNDGTGEAGDFYIHDGGGGCRAGTGNWANGGIISIPKSRVDDDTVAGCIVHEFIHLVYDARDEYETADHEDAACPNDKGPNSQDAEPCLMFRSRTGTELCWGHADGDDLSGGIHDADLVTEQSVTRNGRSCWDQVGWSWPRTMLVPTGAPEDDPGNVEPCEFHFQPADARLVLVLDRSLSMNNESPTRLERLRVAAEDVVEIAASTTELGIVSFSSAGFEIDAAEIEHEIETLGSDRAAWIDAIESLSTNGATNIGAGLDLALDMIEDAGGATAQVGVILMTDGFNNRPDRSGQDLNEKLQKLMDAGVPVYATCIGDELGINSQCAQIAQGTRGRFVDSSDSSAIAEQFVRFHEEVVGRMPASRALGSLASGTTQTHTVPVEAGVRTATFAVQWLDENFFPSVRVTAPDSQIHTTSSMPQGRFVTVQNPLAGTWTIEVSPPIIPQLVAKGVIGVPSEESYVVRSYFDNPDIVAPVFLRHHVIQAGEAFEVCSSPLQQQALLGLDISGFVEAPNGELFPIDLRDDGLMGVSGDERAGDGTYCALFQDTGLTGAYTFRLEVVADGAQFVVEDDDETPGEESKNLLSPSDFVRLAEVSGTVDDSGLADLTAALPFSCVGEPITVQEVNAQMSYVYQPPSPFSILPVGGPAGREINGIGYRTTDDLLYGIELSLAGNEQVVAIDGFGNVFGLGRPAFLPASVRFDSGDVSDDGSTLYLASITPLGQSLFSIDLTSSPVLPAAVPITMSGDTGTVHDLAFNPDDGNLYGGDSDDGEIAVIEPNGTRTDYPVPGLPTGSPFGGVWFDGAGHFFLYDNTGAIFEIDLGSLATPTPVILSENNGPGASRADMAICQQSVVGLSKRMTSTGTGLPRTVTLDFVLENMSASIDLSSLTADDNLSNVFGTHGSDWQFISISSTPPTLANPTFNGHSVTELIAPGQTLAAGSTATIAVEVMLLTHDGLPPDGYFCNQVLVLGRTPEGRWLGDVSTRGLDPDPDGDGSPSENELTCLAAKPSFSCDGEAYVVGGDLGQLHRVDITGPTFSLLPIGLPNGGEVNNLGLRSSDGFLYGLELTSAGNTRVIQIDAAGTPWDLGRPEGLPPEQRFDAGDISSDGQTMYITRHGQPLYKLSLATVPTLPAVTSVEITGAPGHVFDWAAHPTDGLLYGGDSSHGQLAVLDPSNGVRVDHAVPGLPACQAFGAAWFNLAEHLVLYCNNTGILHEIDLVNLQLVGGPSTGPLLTHNDGASCIP